MPAFEVSKSILVNASAEKVFETASDYSTWTTWSPWLCADKNAEVIVSEPPNQAGSTYQWSGEVVGEGGMKHLDLVSPKSIVMELTFIEPWKSRADVDFQIQPVGDQTKITWNMKGSLPFFMFWMKSMMVTFIGMDYERGLKMMKELIETGEVKSDVQINPPVDLDTTPVVRSRRMVGVRDSSTIAEIGPKMDQAYATTTEKLSAAGIATDGDAVAVYHPSDIKKGVFEFTAGFTVADETTIPAGLATCQLPTGKAFHVRHTGCYSNLGNAWSAAHQVARYKRYKLRKTDSFEVYRNFSKETPPVELITDLYLPLK